MRILQTIVFFLFSSSLFGQTKIFQNVISSTGDTTFWFKYQQIVIKELSLIRLDTSTNSFYFRIWKANQVIDIWQNGNGLYSGQLTTWTSEEVPKNEKPIDRTLINKLSISTDTINLLARLIDSSNILKLPTDNLIKGWSPGFDGITYVFEHSTKTEYSFKTYWTPKVQESLVEAKLVQAFVDDVFELANAKFIWQNFEKNIPYECYNVAGNIACKALTKKDRKKYIKERKRFRRQRYLQKQNSTMRYHNV